MSDCCGVMADGSSVAAAEHLEIPFRVTTTNAAVQVVDIANLAAIGAMTNGSLVFAGVRLDAGNEGEMGAQMVLFFNGARSTNGVGATAGLFAAPGYTDPALVPWSTGPGFPAGWGATLQFTGNIFQFAFNGAVGQTIEWVGFIEAWLLGPAVPP